MDSIKIRRAEKDDAEVLLNLIDELATYEQQPKLAPDIRARLIRDGFDEPLRFTTLLAEADDEVVGYALFFETYSSYLAKPTLYLEDIFIKPEARGKGAGLALFKMCVQEAIKRECGRMEWSVLDWNKPAIEFYEKISARHLNDRRVYRMTDDELNSFIQPTG